MWRRKNIVSEPTSSSFKCGPVCIDQKLLPLIQVVWDEKWLNMLIQVSLRAVHKEICKKGRDADLTEISFKGRFKLEPHPHWPPSGVQFSDEHPLHFYMGVLPGITHNIGI